MPMLGDSMNTAINVRDGMGHCEYCGKPLGFKDYRFGDFSHRVYSECDCPTAVAVREERERAEAEAEERKRKEERLSAMKHANIPPKFYDAPLRYPDAFEIVRNGGGLYIQGENGRGKTELAMAIATRMLDAGRKVYAASMVELKGALFSTSYRTETEEQLFAKLSRPWLLVLDDVGKECDSKPVVSMLYRIVDERDKNQRPLIVTSNFPKKELTARLAQCGDESAARAIVSRLFGMTTKYELTGRDWRIPQR